MNLAFELGQMCSEGGFRLHKWVSNSRRVLQSIPDDDQAKDVKILNLSKDPLPKETALGIHWSVQSDAFEFKLAMKDRQCTRHGVLSVLSSVYD